MPLQNFTETLNDVDWNDDINKIDEQLYEKYGLSSDEKMFIEDNVKSMA